MKPLIVGTGLFCLDIVYPPGDAIPSLYAGGSSLNVACILSELGWDAKLIGRIGDDQAAQYLLSDLDSFQIDASSIVLDAETNTPMYSETFNDAGHQFQRKCLQCGAPSPEVKALDGATMEKAIEHLPGSIQTAVIERDGPGSIALAKASKQRGALVYVELNRMNSEAECLELVSYAHVYKYARDRCGMLPAQDRTPYVPLEIETQGKDGLRYRCFNGEWRHVAPLENTRFVDAAGSGDWVSASVIHQIARDGAENFESKLAQIETILAQAQAEAAENGKYIGARGRLYQSRRVQQANDSCPACGGRSQRIPV
ncbi:MAG: PfkB family carbohydrate kinase [Candidatus Hinthialibacter antarcticus]|nr:PfkB family carbohydrate kinase [Candidatus Hinthialibacter antarcticus]